MDRRFSAGGRSLVGVLTTSRHSAGARLCGLAACASLLAAGSAMASGGGIRTDEDFTDSFSFPTLCTLGAACSPTSLGFSVNGSSSIYLYREGIIGLGASLTGGATLGSVVGDYVAPAFGATASSSRKQFRNAHYEATHQPGITLINFDTTDPGGDKGVYQVAFFNNNVASSPLGGYVTGNRTVTISFGYGRFVDCSALPATCGFTPLSQAGWRVGKVKQLFDVGKLPSPNLTLPMAKPSTGTPEPATWAMLVTGFGLVGLAARRRRVAAPA
ncbi:PEPxxWA-CTERM sorting domain-containing protein [Phenylobacterium sp.]|uniref:PEPxxWA-CTERM sorting domain-containing protein n=1 Tax=Phenylobacterium sp. TaxID=1871053 RepID=UPI00286B0202|nr:PEPxxWA-CTERM sorting domain-containing protein [Phenylobacterium sp.]